MRMLTIAYHTLGCKVNQYETEKIRQELESAGFSTVPFSGRADAYVINTCSVTHVADGKSRAAVRRARKTNPSAFIVVTGCYSQLEPAQVRAIEEIDLVIPNSEKEAIPELIAARLGMQSHVSTNAHSAFCIHHSAFPVRPRLRTRAIVKVQDGCDQFCTYCIVPYARPGRRSRPVAEALAEIRGLAEFGYKEVVLTGIRLGSYADGEARLPELIRAVAEIDGIERIRLSSIEPWEVDDALLDAMAHPKVCRHLHVPLQSGDDDVLRRMGRPYTCSEYLAAIERVRSRVPCVGITTDVIVGFPGETDAEFENTCRAVDEAGFSRLHVFRYSPRKRTRAAEMQEQIAPEVKRARAERLTRMGELAMRRFAESLIGHDADVLVERVASRHPCAEGAVSGTSSRNTGSCGKQVSGFADNYVEVTFPGDAALVGGIIRVRITGTDRDGRAVGNVECRTQNA